MLQLPADAEGLVWIDSHDPSKLILVPGLQAASITAAAAGDDQALALLRSTALHFALSPALQSLDARDAFFQAAFPKATCLARGPTWPQHFDADQTLWEQFVARKQHTKQLLHRTLIEGRLASLQWLRALCHPTPGREDGLMHAAARFGDLEAMQYLCTGPLAANVTCSLVLAAADHPQCLRWLLLEPHSCGFGPEFVLELAGNGHLDTLQWLFDQAWVPEHFWDAEVTAAAASSGKLELMQWLKEEHLLVLSASCTRAAAQHGNFAMLQWLRRLECAWDTSCTLRAAHRGDTRMLQWLRAQTPPCPWDGACFRVAAARGNLDLMTCLRSQDNPCPWGPDTFAIAVSRGDLAILDWLAAQDCPIQGPGAWALAASGGHLHVLQWLHSHKIPFVDPKTGECPSRSPSSASALMLVADMGWPLRGADREKLRMARQTFCTFHGLLRWCRHAVSCPSRGICTAFDYLGTHPSGQRLLVRMSRLPCDVIDLIAVKADLQHGIKV